MTALERAVALVILAALFLFGLATAYHVGLHRSTKALVGAMDDADYYRDICEVGK